MKKIMKGKNKGFTLMEVIVVIAILAILAAVAVPTVTGYIEEAKQTNDLQIATNLVKAAQITAVLDGLGAPDGAIVEVLWATRPEANSRGFAIREASVSSRVSAIKPAGYTSKIPTATMRKIQDSILEAIEEDGDVVYKSYGDAILYTDLAESDVAANNSFVFHLNVNTGEVAMAYSAQYDGTKNIWIDEIGVNMTRVP